MGARGAQICKCLLLYKEFERIVINALAIARICIALLMLAALMDGYLWKRSHESIKAAIVGSFTVQIPRMDGMPHSIGKFVKMVL